MRLGLTSRDRRALIVGAWVVLPVLLIGAVGPVIRDLSDVARDRAMAARASLVRSVGRIEALERFARVDSSDNRQRKGAWLFRAPTVLAATADASDVLTGMALVSQAQVRGTTVSGDTAFVDGSARIGMRLSLVADTESLLVFLRELEVGPFIFAVRALSVSHPDPAAQFDRLNVELVLETYAVRRSEASQ